MLSVISYAGFPGRHTENRRLHGTQKFSISNRRRCSPQAHLRRRRCFSLTPMGKSASRYESFRSHRRRSGRSGWNLGPLGDLRFTCRDKGTEGRDRENRNASKRRQAGRKRFSPGWVQRAVSASGPAPPLLLQTLCVGCPDQSKTACDQTAIAGGDERSRVRGNGISRPLREIDATMSRFDRGMRFFHASCHRRVPAPRSPNNIRDACRPLRLGRLP